MNSTDQNSVILEPNEFYLLFSLRWEIDTSVFYI